MGKAKNVLYCFSIVLICLMCILVGKKLYHGYMVDRVSVAIFNGYSVKVEGKEIDVLTAKFMTNSEISEYSIKIDDDKKLVELKYN